MDYQLMVNGFPAISIAKQNRLGYFNALEACPVWAKRTGLSRIYTRHVTPIEEKNISNAANKNRMDRGSTHDLQQTVLVESNLQDVATIVAQMHRNREPLLHTAVYLELCAHDIDQLKLLQTQVLTELIRTKLNVGQNETSGTETESSGVMELPSEEIESPPTPKQLAEKM